MKRIFLTMIMGLLLIPVWAQAEEAVSSKLLEVQPYDRILGNENAPVTIIEYSSLSCPHCAEFHNETLPELTKRYIDTGKVRLIARPFPLNEPALRAAMLTSCVDKKQYYPFNKVLFSLQQKWAMSLDFKDGLRTIAKVGGVSDEAFDACLANKKVEEEVLSIRNDAAEQLSIESTPTFYVNGHKVQGAQPLEEFVKVIDPLLAAASPDATDTEELTATPEQEQTPE